MKKLSVLCLAVALCLVAASAVMAKDVLKMATTTSTANTGLLDVLAPAFEKDTGIELQFVAIGTGKALKLGKNCDVDILMVHAPATEKQYVKDGFGMDRREIMYNDFVIIGPKSDPAGVKGMTVVEALTTIADKKANFASRGDNSGTNKKELKLWKAASIKPEGDWYAETGQGMIKTIGIAEEKEGYTMTDRGTFIKYADNHKGNPPLVVLVEGDKILFNQYSVMIVNPKNCGNTQVELGKKFSDWITSEKVQKMIGDYKLLGKQLFTPNAK